MRSLLLRAAVGIAIVLFAASSASWQMEPVSAQAPTPTPVPGSPTVMIQVDDDKIVVGDPVRITVIAFDDEAVDWIRWQARFADSDNDNDDQSDNADNDEGDNGNDNGNDEADADLLVTPDPATDNSADDDEDNQNENDNDSAIDNDNIDPSADPGLAAVHDFECDEQTACANVWTIMTSKTGRYEIIAEVRDTTGLRTLTRTEIEVRQSR